MATLTKIPDFVEHVAEGVHNLGTNQLAVALSNVAPGAETPTAPTSDGGGVLANVTEVAYTFLSSRNLTLSSSSQTSGTYRLVLADLTLTSTGGATGPFRYIYVYNTAGTGVTNPLIGYYDYGSALTLNDGESLTIDFNPTNGALSIT